MEKICISGPGGQAFTVLIKRKKFQSQRIFQLKQRIKRKSGIPANDQRLTIRQKELQSNKSFRSYGICPGSKIFLQDRRKASNRKARSSPEMTSPDIVYSSNSSLSTSDSDEDCNGSPLGSEISSGNEEDIVLGRSSSSRSQQDNTIQDILQPSKQCTDRSRTEYVNTHLQPTPARIETRDTSSSRLGSSNEFVYDFERIAMNGATKMRYKYSDVLSRNIQPNYTSSERHFQQHRSPVPSEFSPLHHHAERREHNRSMNYTKSPSEQYSEQDVHFRMPASNTHLHSMKNTNHSMTPQDSVYRYMYGNTNPFQYTPPISTSSNRQHIDNTQSNYNYPNNTTHSQVEYPTDYGNTHLQSKVFVPGKIISTHFYTELPRNMQHDRITPSVAPLPLSRGNPRMDRIQLSSGNIPVRRLSPNIHDMQGSSSRHKCSIL